MCACTVKYLQWEILILHFHVKNFHSSIPLLQISKFFGFHNLTCSVHVHVVLKCNFVVLWSVGSTKV